MKRLLILLVTALSALTLCSCSKQNADSESNLQSSSSDTESSNSAPQGSSSVTIMDAHEKNLLDNKKNAEAWKLCDKSRQQTVKKDFDGMEITVTTDKGEYSQDEPIRIKATLKNTTDKDIYLYYADSCVGNPIEFYARLSRGDRKLLNDRPSLCNHVVDIITVKPGEERTDYLNFRTYCFKQNAYGITGGEESAEKGVYSGSCWITTCTNPEEPYGEIANYSVNFSVTLV